MEGVGPYWEMRIRGVKAAVALKEEMRRRRVPDMLVATSAELMDSAVRWQLWNDGRGYLWIRSAVRPWEETLRNPVLGGLFELTRYEVPGAVLLVSVEADRLIRRLC